MTQPVPWHESATTFDCDACIHDGTLFLGGVDGTVRALDLATGAEKWTARLRGIKVHGLAISVDKIFATVSFTGRTGPGLVCGMDTRTGAIAFSVKAPNHVSTGPAIDRHSLLFGTSIGSMVSRSGALYRFDLTTRTVAMLQEGFACAGTPVVSGGDILIASEDGSVRCLDRESGVVRWRFVTRKFLAGTPSVAGDTVLIGSFDHALYAVDRRTGAQRWRIETGGPIRGTPVAAGETVYAASYDEKLHAIALRSGRKLWDYQAKSFLLATPTMYRDLVIIACDDGSVHGIDAATGNARWVLPGDDPKRRGIIAQPLIASDRVIVASRAGAVMMLDASTGSGIAPPFPATAPAPPATVANGKHRVIAHDAGTISLASGRIVACDPFSDLHDRALTRVLKAGVYRMVIGIMDEAGIEPGCVAYLALRSLDAKPVRWERATAVGDTGGAHEVGVDSGVAAIMSLEAAQRLLADAGAEERFGEAAEDQMNDSYGEGRAWASIGVQKQGRADAVVCSSGAGDGSYARHWGLDQKGRPAALVIDFQVVSDTLDLMEDLKG